jgi:hypothetical protein
LNDAELSNTIASLLTSSVLVASVNGQNFLPSPSRRNGGYLLESSSTSFKQLDRFSFSTLFLSGELGGIDAANPIVLSSIQTDIIQSDAKVLAAGVNSLYGWRNELIDACIVRVLKDALVNKNGHFANHSLMKNVALPIDALSYRVRKGLEERCAVSDEDIMRRR